MNPLKTGPWNLTDLKNIVPNGKTVFSCFHCGGGSTMGYKLAGYDVLGGVEIDPEMMKIYRVNHNPIHSYLMGVQQFKNILDSDLPKELFNLDILDGSPPCSSFSMAGSREKAWGKKKKFREGQSEQVLDDLFFDFIDIAKKLKPKIVVAENVKGLIMGKAQGYVKQIYQKFNEAGYDLQLFLLNSAFMGVPQKRERVFFIAKKKNLFFEKLKLEFKEDVISCEKSFIGVNTIGKPNTIEQNKWWALCEKGKAFSSVHPKGHLFNSFKLNPSEPSPTVNGSAGASSSGFYHWNTSNHLSDKCYARLQSFPDDYNYLSSYSVYVNGMSVPPFMMQRISDQIYKQWLKNI